MALFKMMKGDSSRIKLEVTPFTEGYAYFTPDDGGFYIDAEVDGEQRRIRINPKNDSGCTPINATLKAGQWDGGDQTLSIQEVTSESNGVMGISQEVSEDALDAIAEAMLYISAQGEGSVTVTAYGDEPKVDIPVVLLLF